MTLSESRTGNALKPCPFCGAKLVSSVFNGRVHKFWDHLYSGEPPCPAAARRVDVTDPDHVAAWNRRTLPPAGEGGEALRAIRYVLLNQLLGSELNGGKPPVIDGTFIDAMAEDIVADLAALQADTGEGGKGLRDHRIGSSWRPSRAGSWHVTYTFDDGAAAAEFDRIADALTSAQPLRSGKGS